MTSRTLPLLRVVSVSTRAGDDPDIIDDAHAVYGDTPDEDEAASMFYLGRTCPRNADGLHCEYGDALVPGPCVHCGQEFDL